MTGMLMERLHHHLVMWTGLSLLLKRFAYADAASDAPW